MKTFQTYLTIGLISYSKELHGCATFRLSISFNLFQIGRWSSVTLDTLNETFGDDMTSQIGTTLYVAPEMNAEKTTASYNQKVKNTIKCKPIPVHKMWRSWRASVNPK